MTEKVKMFYVVVILLSLYQYACMGMCKGADGLPCCFGYMWDQDQAVCIRCKVGYIGTNCDDKCPFPYFGLDCQSTCNCSAKICDYVNGCKHSTSEQPYSSSRFMGFNFKAISTTLYTIGKHKGNFNATVVKDDENNLQTDLKSTETAPYQANSLMHAIIGLSVAAVIITVIYIYTCILEKRKLPTNTI